MSDLKKHWVKKSALTMTAKFHNSDLNKVIEVTISDDADAANEIMTAMTFQDYTASEYTGYSDKNANPIFEEDIVSHDGGCFTVFRGDYEFMLHDKSLGEAERLDRLAKECEIIGNTTENSWLVD